MMANQRHRKKMMEWARLSAWNVYEPERIRFVGDDPVPPPGWPEGAVPENCFSDFCKARGMEDLLTIGEEAQVS